MEKHPCELFTDVLLKAVTVQDWHLQGTPNMSDIVDGDNVPFWAISGSCYCGENFDLTIRCNGKRFYIMAEADDLHGDLKEEFLGMVTSEDLELEDWVAEPLLPALKELAPSPPDSLTLAEFYNPETFTFKLVSNDGKLSCVRLPDDTDPNAYNSPKIPLSKVPAAQRIKSLDPSTATVMRRTEEDFGADTPTKVLVDGKCYHFKAVQDRHSFLREFGILSKLAKAGLNQKLRVPTIYSLVHHAGDEGSILGFLMEVINSKDKLDFLFTRGDTEPQERQKWMSQIEDTVRQLHENGIVWGDVKPDNVLIDEDGNAWIIDFGGGYNSRFVDEDVIETVEGDVQGISRIKEWLGV